MQMILVKLTLYVTEKCKKKKKEKKNHFFYFFISWHNPVKVKKNAPKEIKQFPSGTCCKHSLPLPYYYWPVNVVLQQYADGMATV